VTFSSRISSLAFLLSVLVSPGLFAASSELQTNPHSSVRLLASQNQVPASGELLLGLHFKPIDKWYVYWKNPGEAGYPPTVDWKGSRGFANPEFLWPAPVRIVLPGPIEEFGYEGEVIYPVRVKLTGKPVQVRAQVSYLICYTSCIPYRVNLALDIPAAPSPKKDPESSALIEKFLAQVPSPEKTDEQIMREARTVYVTPGEEQSATTPRSLLWILLLGFLGGVILNVMPCVLPVLSIKLAGLLQHSGQSAAYIIKSSLASALGILVSFEALALVAILARRAGHAIGWGIQFQNPFFVTFLMLVVLFFALNLWGVFEIQMPRFLGRVATRKGDQESFAAHFVSGLFATLLATPCSAPFLGTAMGFALSQKDPIILATFASVGIGMALPYLILAAFPKSVRWLPKPGAWMITLKKGLALLLVATAAWLGWVLYQQIGAKRMAAEQNAAWMTFDETAISKHVSAGRPVFVDVTADWCVTCKYNERFVLSDPRVMKEFEKQNMVLMKADWTNRDAIIAAYLMRHGRAGIPFYAYYRPGKPAVLLSEFLTVNQVLKTLQAPS
jgi:thiol:disulfide interchange protein